LILRRERGGGGERRKDMIKEWFGMKEEEGIF